MKLTRGGGGIDASGNAFTLEPEEIEVADDYFERLWFALKDIPPRITSPSVRTSKLQWTLF